MRGWKECKLGDAITLQRGHDLPKSKMMKGSIPVAGSNGIIGYHNEATTSAPGITIGRSGNLGNAYFYKEDFWAHNTTLYVKDFKGNNELFIYYFLKIFDFKQFNVGSAVPTLNRNHIHPLDVIIPPLHEQKAIASVLSSLDDKIDLLHRQNKTLEATAETFFRQWFVEEANEEWEKIPYNYFVEKISVRLNSENLKDRKYVPIDELPKKQLGIFSFKPIEEAKSSLIAFEPGDILFGAMRAYFHRVNFSSFSGVTRTTTMVLRPKKNYYFSFALLMLNLNSSVAYANNYSKGSTMPYAVWENSLELLPCVKPDDIKLLKFNNLLEPLFSKINQNVEQIRTLEKLRDTLLPKLMSGEVRVNYEKETGKLAEDFISRHIEENMNPFKEAVLFSGVVAVMSDEKFNPDRVRVTKAGYFAKRYMGMDVLGEYSKMAAGPYDSYIRYKGPEKIAEKNGYVESVGKTQFKKGLKFHDAEKYLEKYGYKPAIEWLEQFKYMKNKELELLSTVDYVALDLILQRKDVSTESVIDYIKADNDWKRKIEEKVNIFNLEKIRWALEKLAVMFPKTYNKNLKGIELNG